MALLGKLQHETQPGIGPFILHAGEAPSPTFEADAAGLAQTHSIEGPIGPRGKGLRQHRIQVVGDPRTVQAFGRVVQRVLRKPVLLAQRCKGALALRLLRVGNGASCLPVGVGTHAAQPPLSFRQDCVIELAGSFQTGAEALCLTGGHLERQLQEKGRRRFAPVRFSSVLVSRCLGIE